MFLLFLIETFDKKNGKLLRVLVEEHSDKLYSIAYSYLKNHHDAKDAVQDVFINVYKNIEFFYELERDKRVSLLVKYTRNKAIDYIRRKKRRPDTISLSYEIEDEEINYEIPDFTNTPEEKYLEKEALEKVAELISTLPDAQREVVEMRYRYSMSNREIAEALNINTSAVTSRMNRAKSTLLKLLKGENDE